MFEEPFQTCFWCLSNHPGICPEAPYGESEDWLHQGICVDCLSTFPEPHANDCPNNWPNGLEEFLESVKKFKV